jgi:hypothetical protein
VIKEKHCGKIKGCAVADGRPQMYYIPCDEAASPTVSLESLVLSLMIDAHEGRDVAIADVAGAFLKGDMPDFVLITPKYYICNSITAIIWYDTFCGTLKNLGFKLNPYDPCIANKMVNGKQLTIDWYIDDNKISYVDPKIVDWLIAEIEKRHDKMIVCRGKKHTFIGMDIEFLDDGRLKILMKDYISEAIEDFNEDVTRKAASPAAKGLFEVNSQSKRLSQDKSDKFHSIVAKLLYVCI